MMNTNGIDKTIALATVKMNFATVELPTTYLGV